MSEVQLMVDEFIHKDQILFFINSEYKVHYKLTVIPAYHFFVASIMEILGNKSIFSMRFISTIISGLSVLVFKLIVDLLGDEDRRIKAFQYLFFPILIPFFFLVYTDVLSVLFILGTVYFILKRNYRLAGVSSILSFLVRQNNIVWLVGFSVFSYLHEYGFKVGLRQIKAWIKTNYIFFCGVIIFLFFVYFNGGVVIGDRSAHPDFKFYSGNVFFMLFLFFLIFLPLNISNFKKIWDLIFNKWYFLVFILMIFAVYMLTFRGDHPYNLPKFWLRNYLLSFFGISSVIKGLLFVPIGYSILSLAITKYRVKYFEIFYLFSIIFLIPSELIEQRYYLIPFTLFLLFRKIDKSKLRIEYLQLGYFVALSFVITWGIHNQVWFL